MKILEKSKSFSMIALAAIFFLSASVMSCGDSKKDEASDDQDAIEEVIEVEADSTEHPAEEINEHPADSTEHPSEGEEHPADDEHPSDGDEHPSN